MDFFMIIFIYLFYLKSDNCHPASSAQGQQKLMQHFIASDVYIYIHWCHKELTKKMICMINIITN